MESIIEKVSVEPIIKNASIKKEEVSIVNNHTLTGYPGTG
jgi:hypothetical protein